MLSSSVLMPGVKANGTRLGWFTNELDGQVERDMVLAFELSDSRPREAVGVQRYEVGLVCDRSRHSLLSRMSIRT